MEIVTGVFVYGPLCVCFQSSDSEVRRLSGQLSQRDRALQQLEQERDRLVQLDQVRAQKDALSNTQLKRKSIITRLQNTPHTPKYINSLKGTWAIKRYLWQQEEWSQIYIICDLATPDTCMIKSVNNWKHKFKLNWNESADGWHLKVTL